MDPVDCDADMEPVVVGDTKEDSPVVCDTKEGETSSSARSPSPSFSSDAFAVNGGISWHGKRSIINYNPPWPVCQYHEVSRRVDGRRRPTTTPARYLDRLNGWAEHRVISVDGMNGTGKSTLAGSMNRMYMKINTHCPDVTSGSSYNYAPLRALEYMMFHALYDTKETFVVWDRCRYSNLIFAYIHHLMSVYRDTPMPGPDDDEPFLYINNMALATGLFMTVTYMESVCAESKHVLFIVCSDLQLVMQALLFRGGANDVYNAKERNYQMAQYHVYRYFASLLDAPLLDLSVLFRDCDMTLDEIQMEVKSRVDVPYRLDQDALPPPPRRDESVALHEFCDAHDDTMVYVYSAK